MLSVQDARIRLLAALPELAAETVPLHLAVGRILAQPLRAAFPLPAFHNSGMDGFALRAEDISGANTESPVTLQVVGDIPAGSPAQFSLGPRQAARIMTGAALPEGADAVVPVERTDFQDRTPGSQAPAQVKVLAPVESGEFVRRQGEDVAPGALLLAPGVRLRPQDVAMAAMTGAGELHVFQQPRVAVLSTGDELLAAGSPPAPGKIYESNGTMVAALVEEMGGIALRLGIARDNEAAVLEKLEAGVDAQADMIISSAGVSVGAFDFVKSAVESAGGLDFWRVNMRPGRPLAFGSYRGLPFVGLPGNPVSAFVGFEVFLRPALAKMTGWSAWRREMHRGFLAEAVESDGRESYLRAVVRPENGAWTAALTGHQGSGNQFSLVQANALVVVPAGEKSLPAGAEVEIWKLS